jgi:hypothetical protein
VVYSWFCPQCVKSSESASQFCASSGDKLAGIEIVRMEEALRNGDAQSKKSIIEIRRGWPTGPPANIEEQRYQASFDNKNIIMAYYELEDRSQPSIRVVCGVFYAVGFVLLLLPSMSVFLKVAQILIRHI